MLRSMRDWTWHEVERNANSEEGQITGKLMFMGQTQALMQVKAIFFSREKLINHLNFLSEAERSKNYKNLEETSTIEQIPQYACQVNTEEIKRGKPRKMWEGWRRAIDIFIIFSQNCHESFISLPKVIETGKKHKNNSNSLRSPLTHRNIQRKGILFIHLHPFLHLPSFNLCFHNMLMQIYRTDGTRTHPHTHINNLGYNRYINTKRN